MDQIQDKNSADELWLEEIALKEAIEKLSEREKKIILLRYYQGKTQMEVSQEVGMSQAQVSRMEKTSLNKIKRNI